MRIQNLAILNNANSNDGTFMQYKGFWKFGTNDYTDYYLHMKTNINTAPNMWMIEAVGYNYCYATKVRSAWTFHWDGNGLYNISYRWLGGVNGLKPTNVYRSTDGYIVLVGYTPCWGYNAFILNAYNTADNYNQSSLGNGQVPTILATSFSSNNSGVY